MIDQQINKLAASLLALIENERVLSESMSVDGGASINEFLASPGVKSYLLALNVEKKVRLWGERGSGLQILFHGADNPKKSSPHDHGQSWALYHQVVGETKMSTYHRTLGRAGFPGRAVLELTDQKDLTPGNAMFFEPLVIHSTNHPSAPARWLRVTGTDLDFYERLRFSIEREEAVMEKRK